MMAVNRLAQLLGITWTRERQLGNMVAHAVKEDSHGNQLQVVLIKPTLPMNVNGKCVVKAVSKFSICMEHILIIHDDLDTAVGKYKVKVKGSAAGHNGVKSVISSLRSDDFLRLKIGIGRPASKADVVDYVLQRFSNEEDKIIHDNMDKALQLGLQQLADKVDFNPGILGEQFSRRPRRTSTRKRTISLEDAGPSRKKDNTDDNS